MTSRWMFLSVLVAVLIAGCGRKSEPPAASASAGAASPAEAATAAEPDMTAVLAELTQQVRKYGFEKQRVPASLEELVTAGYLASVPQVPGGKKFSIEPKTMQVVLK